MADLTNPLARPGPVAPTDTSTGYHPPNEDDMYNLMKSQGLNDAQIQARMSAPTDFWAQHDAIANTVPVAQRSPNVAPTGSLPTLNQPRDMIHTPVLNQPKNMFSYGAPNPALRTGYGVPADQDSLQGPGSTSVVTGDSLYGGQNQLSRVGTGMGGVNNNRGTTTPSLSNPLGRINTLNPAVQSNTAGRVQKGGAAAPANSTGGTNSSGQNPYGSFGQYDNNNPNSSQGTWGTTSQILDDNGTAERQFKFNNPRITPLSPNQGGTGTYGGYIDGNKLQVGSAQGNPDVIDPSKITYDPEFGYITTTDNLKSFQSDGNVFSGALRDPAFQLIGLAGGMYGLNQLGMLPAADGALSGATPGSLDFSQLPPFNPEAPNFPPIEGVPGGSVPSLDFNQLPMPDPNNPQFPSIDPGFNPTVPGAASSLGSLASNPMARTGAGLAASALTGGTSGNPGSRTNNSTPGSAPGGTTGNPLLDAALGIGNYALDRNSINEYKGFINDLLSKGDWNTFRKPGLDMLQRSYTDPESFLNDPTYQSLRQRNLDTLSAKENSIGQHLSGNELAELSQRGHEQDYQHLSDIRAGLSRDVSMGNPQGMYSSALRNADTLLQARSNQNAGATNAIGRFLQSGAGRSLLDGLKNGSIDPNSLDPKEREALENEGIIDQNGNYNDGWDQGPGSDNIPGSLGQDPFESGYPTNPDEIDWSEII